jgi:hypothetical protein
LTVREPQGNLLPCSSDSKETRSGQVLKLVESYRDDTARPRHRAVVSLGNAPLAREDWKPVAKAVEDRLYGREALLARELSTEHAAWVDRIVRQVGNEGRQRCRDPQALHEGLHYMKLPHRSSALSG